MAGFRLALKLTPHGRLAVAESDDAPELAPELARRLWEAFSQGTGFGLRHLGAREIGEALPAAFAYWREFASRFVTALCTRTGADDRSMATPDPPLAELAELALVEAPPPENTDGHFEDWRALVQRTDLSPRELRLLEHMARKMAARP